MRTLQPSTGPVKACYAAALYERLQGVDYYEEVS